jgi:hypothetical protein
VSVTAAVSAEPAEPAEAAAVFAAVTAAALVRDAALPAAVPGCRVSAAVSFEGQSPAAAVSPLYPAR